MSEIVKTRSLWTQDARRVLKNLSIFYQELINLWAKPGGV
jgi:hypothetical protein